MKNLYLYHPDFLGPRPNRPRRHSGRVLFGTRRWLYFAHRLIPYWDRTSSLGRPIQVPRPGLPPWDLNTRETLADRRREFFLSRVRSHRDETFYASPFIKRHIDPPTKFDESLEDLYRDLGIWKDD